MKKHGHLVGGEFVDSSDWAPNINPSNTGDVIGGYARADEGLTRQAIEAARAALPGWSLAAPQVRADALDRVGSEILARKDEIGNLLAREEGKTLPEAIGEVARAGQIFKFFAGEALRVGDKQISVRPGPAIEVTREPELPDRDSGLEGRACAGLRQLRRVQAGRTGARQRVGAGRNHQPQRRSGRRLQPRDGARQCCGRHAAEPRRRRCGHVHRFDVDRGTRRSRLRRAACPVPARNGRQESVGCAERRRPRHRGSLRDPGRLLLDRTALHRIEPARCRGRHSRSLRRCARGVLLALSAFKRAQARWLEHR